MDVKIITTSNYVNMLVCRKHWCIHCCHQLKFGCLEKQRSVRNFLGTFKSRMKGIDSGYKLNELLSVRGGSINAVLNVVTVGAMV